ncbi:MAG: hypothetical protein P1P90_02100 [Patescibacteria group bacterium]|nr:hypothetical protein [Patescibacteria group bacterium]
MADDRTPPFDLQVSDPDLLSEPSKKLTSIQKRNSEKGKRNCKNPSCNKALAVSNEGPYCFTCDRKVRLGNIKRASTKFISADDMDMDFDSDDRQK